MFMIDRTGLNWNLTAEIEKRDRIINYIKLKIAEVKTAEIKECLYFPLRLQNAINVELNINMEIMCQEEMVVMIVHVMGEK